MKDHQVANSTCPKCGHKFSAAMNAQSGHDQAPKPGDYTICIKCGEILVFVEGMGVRFINEDDEIEIHGDPELAAALTRAQEAVRMIHRVN